jgi:hypothetical protein
MRAYLGIVHTSSEGRIVLSRMHVQVDVHTAVAYRSKDKGL